MALSDRVVGQASDATGVFQLIVVVEDTQATTDERGRFSPTVVAVKLVNTSARRGSCTWQSPNGAFNTREVLSGENSETNIAPSRREFLHQWGAKANAYWGS